MRWYEELGWIEKIKQHMTVAYGWTPTDDELMDSFKRKNPTHYESSIRAAYIDAKAYFKEDGYFTSLDDVPDDYDRSKYVQIRLKDTLHVYYWNDKDKKWTYYHDSPDEL